MGIDLELPPLNLRTASRELTQEELELYKWKGTLSAVKQSEINLLNLYLRKVRLVKLRKFIDEALAKMKRPSQHAGNKDQDTNIVTSPDKRKKELLDLAKKKGNEYSKMNRFHDHYYHQLDQPKKVSSKGNLSNGEGYVYSRHYGNMLSERNLSKIQAKKFKNRSGYNLTEDSGAWSKKRHQIEYGNYTSMRNKLLRKESQGQFDEEYSELLLKCINFERQHLQVQGYLEKKLLANPHLVNNYKNMIEGLITPQPSECSMEELPTQEVFDNTETFVKGCTKVRNCISEEQSESVINCYSYENENQEEPSTYEIIEQKESVLKFELEQISETIIKNGDFQQVVFDIVDRYESNRRIGDRPQNLLTDLYLAYTLNLMKTAAAKKFIEGRIDMSGIKNQIIDQSSNLSLVLSQVLRCEEN